jgi:hypothetical protein
LPRLSSTPNDGRGLAGPILIFRERWSSLVACRQTERLRPSNRTHYRDHIRHRERYSGPGRGDTRARPRNPRTDLVRRQGISCEQSLGSDDGCGTVALILVLCTLGAIGQTAVGSPTRFGRILSYPHLLQRPTRRPDRHDHPVGRYRESACSRLITARRKGSMPGSSRGIDRVPPSHQWTPRAPMRSGPPPAATGITIAD